MFVIDDKISKEVINDIQKQRRLLRIFEAVKKSGIERTKTKPIFLGKISFNTTVSICYKDPHTIVPYQYKNDEITSIKISYEKHFCESNYQNFYKFYALLKLKGNTEIKFLVYCSKNKSSGRFTLKNKFYCSNPHIKYVQINKKRDFLNFEILIKNTKEYLKREFEC